MLTPRGKLLRQHGQWNLCGEKMTSAREGEREASELDLRMGKENVTSRGVPEHKSEELRCFECKRSLVNSPELITVTGQSQRQWHPECFKCMICREPMDKRQSCHVYEDQIVCRSDYLRLKRDSSIKCARCRWPIGPSDWVRRAASHVYHLACFNCDICLRQLNTGEQFILSPENARDDRATRDQRPQPEAPVRLLCRLHFTIDHTARSRNEARQQQRQQDGDANPPDGEKQQVVCVPDDEKGRQRQSSIQHSPGSRANSSLEAAPMGLPMVGQLPFEASNLQPAIGQPDLSISVGPGPSSSSPGLANDTHLMQISCGPSQHQLAGSSNTSPPSTNSSNHTVLLGGGGPLTPTSSHNGGSNSPSKSKRVRTTFTEDQLRILQHQFQIDSNPDGQDLEKIATITGLTKRVTQVWFQNSRARQKKYMTKRKPPMHHHHHHPLGQHHNAHNSQQQPPQHQALPGLTPETQSEEDEDGPTDTASHVKALEELSHYYRRENLFINAIGLGQTPPSVGGDKHQETSQASWQEAIRADQTPRLAKNSEQEEAREGQKAYSSSSSSSSSSIGDRETPEPDDRESETTNIKDSNK